MMKNLLAISCLIVASLFVSATQASLCETLAPKTTGPDQTQTALVTNWVKESITLYAANPAFGTFFASINESSTAAHVSFYGSLIGCTELPVPTSGNMSEVHSTSAISAADFDAYVELTREALQSVVDNMSVAEMTQFYQIFESFREYNTLDTICNQEDCQTPTSAIVLSGTAEPLAFDKAYIATSATTLSVNNTSSLDAELYYVPATASDCTNKVLLESIAPNEVVGTLDLPFLASGVYYIFQATAAEECFVDNTPFNNTVLIVDFTYVEVVLPPVMPPTPEPPVPVEPPTQEPVAEPVAEPVVEPPTQTPDQAPVDAPTQAPIDPPTQVPTAEVPVATPIAPEPVQVPVAATPVAVPVDNITPAAAEEGFSASGYIAGIVILVLIVIGLLIAVIVMGVKLRRNSTVAVVA